jgi:hypothetical protein
MYNKNNLIGPATLFETFFDVNKIQEDSLLDFM